MMAYFLFKIDYDISFWNLKYFHLGEKYAHTQFCKRTAMSNLKRFNFIEFSLSLKICFIVLLKIQR